MTDPENAPPRILIVDDSRMVRASIIKHVRASYEVREESDGEAGWQTLLFDPSIQLVISDLSMPKLDGYGLLERIRGSKVARLQDLPVIMISGDEDDAARARAKDLGATDFITKGIGTVELLARLDASVRAAQARRELEASREALAQQAPIDPALGLVNRQYMHLHGEQLLSLARRQHGELSLMAIEIDRFDELRDRFGAQVCGLIIRKLAKILATRVRKEDTVAQLGEARFCVVSPAIAVSACAAFATRLRAAIDSIALGYRGETIRISLTIGLANTRADRLDSIDALIGRALERLAEGVAAGGNQVVGGVPAEAAGADATPSIERALALIHTQQTAELRPHLASLVRRLMPILHLVEDEYRVGMPLAQLTEKCAQTTSLTGTAVDCRGTTANDVGGAKSSD